MSLIKVNAIATRTGTNQINVADIANSATIASSVGSSTIGFIGTGTGSVARTIEGKLRDVVSVKDFGALGDGTGRTPADDGVNVLLKPWNTWDGTPFKYDPSNPTNYNLNSPYVSDSDPDHASPSTRSFNPPRAQPFANDELGTLLVVH